MTAMRRGRGREAMRGILVLAVVAMVAGVPGGAFAQAPSAPDAAAQPAGQTVALSRAELEQLPSVTVSLAPEHGAPVAYAGPLLWTLLQRADAVGQEPRGRVRRVVTVTGRDGYSVVLALSEMDPEFEGKQVIVAIQADGMPIGAGELRLVVPGDKRPGRSVRNPVSVVVR